MVIAYWTEVLLHSGLPLLYWANRYLKIGDWESPIDIKKTDFPDFEHLGVAQFTWSRKDQPLLSKAHNGEDNQLLLVADLPEGTTLWTTTGFRPCRYRESRSYLNRCLLCGVEVKFSKPGLVGPGIHPNEGSESFVREPLPVQPKVTHNGVTLILKQVEKGRSRHILLLDPGTVLVRIYNTDYTSHDALYWSGKTLLRFRIYHRTPLEELTVWENK